jgi:hypothetical protein
MEGDISNKTIVVLVLLTVIISVLSTMVVLNEVMNVKIESNNAQAQKAQSSSTGVVEFKIVDPATLPKTSDSVTGQVVFNVKAR